MDCGSCQAAGYIRAAPAHGVDLSVHVCAIKTRNHGILQRKQGSAHGPACQYIIQHSVFIKADAPGRINKSETKPGGEDPGIQILAPADDFLFFRFFSKAFAKRIHFTFQRKVKSQTRYNLSKTLLYL